MCSDISIAVLGLKKHPILTPNDLTHGSHQKFDQHSTHQHIEVHKCHIITENKWPKGHISPSVTTFIFTHTPKTVTKPSPIMHLLLKNNCSNQMAVASILNFTFGKANCSL